MFEIITLHINDYFKISLKFMQVDQVSAVIYLVSQGYLLLLSTIIMNLASLKIVKDFNAGNK